MKSTIVFKRRGERMFRRYLAIAACMVVVVIAVALMVPALSMTRGDLVCGMQEHAHAQACYEQVLVCGLEEGEGADSETGEGGHVHTKACYEKQLVCDTPEHDHTDNCYAPAVEPEGDSASGDSKNADNASKPDANGGKSESATEEHAVQSDVGSSDENSQASDKENAVNKHSQEQYEDEATAKPAQSFTADLKDADGNVTMTVNVEAPKGAFPAGTHMKIDGVDPAEIRAKLAEAIDADETLRAALGERTADECLTWMSTVSIRFTDADGKVAVPAKKAIVKITAPEVRDLPKPILMRTVEKKDDSGDATVESAEIVRKVKRVNADDADKSEGNEDTLKFKTTDFTTYAIVGLDVEATNVEVTEDEGTDEDEKSGEDSGSSEESADPAGDAADNPDARTLAYTGRDYEITLTYDASAEIPDDAQVKAEEILPATEDFKNYLNDSIAKLGAEGMPVTFARFFDIEIVDRDGNKVEPKAFVQVQITYNDALEVKKDEELNVVHFAEYATEVISDVELNKDGTEVSYEQDSFSVTGTIITGNGDPAAQNEYAVVIKYSNKYYAVRADGSLEEVVYNVQQNVASVTMDFPMTWTYRSAQDVAWYEPYVLRMAAEAAQFDGNDLPIVYSYRYIDPNSDAGIREEIINPDKTVQGLAWDCELRYEENDHTLHGTNMVYQGGNYSYPNNGKYIGVVNENGKLHIVGNRSESDAAEVYFASITTVPEPYGTGNTVNHIDISVTGTVDINIPLAYGTYYYYDENNELQTLEVSAENPFISRVHNYTVAIKKEDMMKADISAYKKNADGSTTDLDNMFYVTGYSDNGKADGDSADQVRIEGSFKVSYTDVPGRNGNPQSRAARLETPVYYMVTAPKSVTVPLEYSYTDGNDQTHSFALYDQNPAETGESPLTANATASVSASFTYWDFNNNKCPAAMWNLGGIWRAGDIPDGLDEDKYHSGSGMDFVLSGGGASQAQVYAIEITKIVVDENGNRIKSSNAGTNTLHIYRNGSASADSVKDLNIGSATQTPDYTGYQPQHDKRVVVGADGLGMVYDYDVTPGMYYIAEDPDSISQHITDTSGQQWDYKETYFLTEYAWRDHQNDNYMHVSETSTGSSGAYSSVPEILGDHPSYNGNQTFTNDFLEFYVYNVYESPKVDVPVQKTWPDFDGEGHEDYDWTATFKLQWAPLYPGESTPSEAFTDVVPVQEITITKDQMASAEAQAASLADRTFQDLPKYGTDKNGNTFRYQYSLEETSYQVTNTTTGVILYSWSETEGYNTEDEDTHYHPFYPHDAGETEAGQTDEQNAADANYYIEVRNAKRNISSKETIDVSIDKQWDSSFTNLDDTRYAEFELRRFAHTEYRDLSHMSESDRDPERAVTVTIKDSGGNTIDSLQVQPNVGVYLAGNFKPHDETKAVTFTSDTPVRLPSGSHVSTITTTAEGSNQSNALVRSGEFFVTHDTVFTLASGAENLITEGKVARVLDTSAGTSPLPDASFRRTIRLDSTNNWHVALDDLIRSVTSAGDDDDNENVTYYEYYLVEMASNPKGYAQYFLADTSGSAPAPTTTLLGDSDHQIETDAAIVAVNGPANRLIVEKKWRGVPDATGYPHVKFTLYQTWADGGNISTSDGWVYENENTHERYEHVELPAHSLEWICPEVLPTTKLDGSTSRQVGYYVVEDERSGSHSNEGITTNWQFYYYLNSDGKQTNAGHQGYFAGLTGASLAGNGGKITICNAMGTYVQLDIQKQFFKLLEAGSWDNVTAHADMKKGAVLGFKVLRAVKTPDGKYIDEHGQVSESRVWMDYGDEMLCGYDENGSPVMHNDNGFYLKGGDQVGGDWAFRIEDNQGDKDNVNAGGSGLPNYGYYVLNGDDIAVEYEYTFRETAVYKDLDRTPYPEWDWYSSVLPGQYNKIIAGQDNMRIANIQASDLLIHKQWIGDVAAKEVYVKLWRVADDGQPEDFTSVIADDVKNNHNWQMYLDDESEIDVNHKWLILKDDGSGHWTDSLKVNRALLGTVNAENDNAARYQYYIQEVAYKALDGTVHTNVNAKFKPLYDKWVGTAAEGGWTDAPVGMNEYANNAISIGAKGENQLKVINRSSPSTSYKVTKAFHGPQSSTGGQSSVTGKYPTDGSKHVVVSLQQRYRYEKTEGGVDYVSADYENWVQADSAEAATTWTVDWQAAESASPVAVALPLSKPEGSTLSDAAWYGSAAAWTYTWEGLDVTKVVSDAANPEETRVAQLYYRAVEPSAPEWFSGIIATDEQDGHKAIDDESQTTTGIQNEKNTVTNERGDCDLELNKEWTGLGEGKTWPEGYTIDYQLVQHFQLALVDVSDIANPAYSAGKTFKSVDMTTASTGASTADSAHPQAIGRDVGKPSDGSTVIANITGLPVYGFLTATADDVAEAAEAGVTLVEGTAYPVVYTYSVRETAVKKNGEAVPFKPQTVAAERVQPAGDSDSDGDPEIADATEGVFYAATLLNEMANVEVTKTWADDKPYADSVTVKLYRTTEIPADELCSTTINLRFGENYNQVTSQVIMATVAGKTVELVKSGDSDLWTGSVGLEKGTTQTVSFATPEVADGYTLTLEDQQIAVPDATTHTIDVSGSVAAPATERTIKVNVSWTDGRNPSAAYQNLFYAGWGSTGINAVVAENGTTRSFTWSGVPTSGSNLFVQLGYSGYNFNNCVVSATGYQTRQWINNNSELILDDIAAGPSNVTIDVSITPPSAPAGGTASITLVNNTGDGIWVNPLRNSGQEWSFGQWLNDGASNTVSNLAAGEYTVQLGNNTGVNSGQIVGASSIDQWGNSVNIHVALSDGEDKTIYVNASGGVQQNASGARSLLRVPLLRANAVVPSSTTVALSHEDASVDDVTLQVEGADEYPSFTADDLVDTQTLTSANNWHYEWSELPACNPVTGERYYYYVMEDVPANTEKVTYARISADNSTTVTINNEPVVKPEYASLVVTKSVVDAATDEALEISRDFTIRLKRDDKYLKWTSATSYEWVDSADEASTWTFNNGGSVTFFGLDVGSEYTIVEDTSSGMVEIEGYSFDGTASTTACEVTAESATEYDAAIVNKYVFASAEIGIIKVDAEDADKKLSGAKFRMTRVENGTNVAFENDAFDADSVTGKKTGPFAIADEGGITISGLTPGTYHVEELEAPAGYVIAAGGNAFTFTIASDKTVAYDNDNSLVTYLPDSGAFQVGNMPGKELPHTGGSGSAPFYLFGGLLVACATAALLARRRLTS